MVRSPIEGLVIHRPNIKSFRRNGESIVSIHENEYTLRELTEMVYEMNNKESSNCTFIIAIIFITWFLIQIS